MDSPQFFHSDESNPDWRSAAEMLNKIERLILESASKLDEDPELQALKQSVDNLRLTIWATSSANLLSPSQGELLNRHYDLRRQVLCSPTAGADAVSKISVSELFASVIREKQKDAAEARSQDVLIIEDDMTIREMVSDSLVGKGLRVRIAANASDALRILNETTFLPDVVISDVFLPDVNGVMICAIIKKLQPAARMFYMTGVDRDLLVREDLMPTDGQVFYKPFAMRNLVNAVVN